MSNPYFVSANNSDGTFTFKHTTYTQKCRLNSKSLYKLFSFTSNLTCFSVCIWRKEPKRVVAAASEQPQDWRMSKS